MSYPHYPYYPPYPPYPPPAPPSPQEPTRHAERHALRKRALFVGTAMLSVPVAGIVLAFTLARLDIADEAMQHKGSSGLLMYTLVQTAMTLLYIIVPVLICALAFGQHVRPLSQRRRMGGSTLALLLLAGMGCCLFANTAAHMVQQFCKGAGIPTGYSDPVSEQLQTGAGPFFSSLWLTAVLPALFEELALRGLVLESLRPFGDGKAVLASSLLFALLHGNLVQIPFAFIMGLVFGYVYVQTDNLAACIALHFLNNGVLAVGMQFLALYVPEGTANTASILLMVGLALAGCAALLYLLWKRHPVAQSAPQPASALSSQERTRLLWSTPTVVVALVVLALMTLLAMAAGVGGSA